jgi:tetratricopeptide (TPR) repeat protein
MPIAGRAANPNAVHTRLGRIFAATGRFNEAIAEFQKLRDSSAGEAYAEAEIASAHAAAGRTAEALAGLGRLIERSTSEEVSPELFSLVYTRLGRFDDAFRHLHEAMNIKARRILWMKVDPRWDPLRSDARFDVLLKRLGL